MRILDGALGTELSRRGFALQAPSFAIAANHQDPGLVQAIHREYLEAGAEELTLNSFGLSQGLDMQDSGFDAALGQRSQAVVQLARAVAPSAMLCAALTLGQGADPAARLLLETSALLEQGIRRIRLETLVDPEPLFYIRAPLLERLAHHRASLCLSLCPARTHISELLSSIQDQGWFEAPCLDAVGINCVDRPTLGQQLPDLAATLRALPRDLALELRPHLSQALDGAWQTHACGPDELVTWYQELLDETKLAQHPGLALGTCCGGGPEHIRALQNAWKTS